MPVDIGPRIGIDGEAEFRRELQNINQQLRTLGSEMRAVTSQFDQNDRSQENLSQQAGVLTRQIEAQEQKLSSLNRMLDESARKYGENDTKTLRWAQAVNDATTDLNKMRSQLSKTEREMDGLGDETEDTAKEFDNLADKSAPSLINGLADIKGGFDLVSQGAELVIGFITDAVSAFVNLAEATEDYRTQQGLLLSAFEAAGYTQESANTAYREFFKILGESDTAVEASQLLARLTQNEKDIVTWTSIAAGVYGTFGEALPINGLIEATNETVKVGKVTGVLADALNWAGINEDLFNEKLAACTTESERNQLIMDTLSETYDTASDAFYRNNEQLVKNREQQVLLDQSTGNLGGAVAELSAKVREDFAPALAEVTEAFAEVVRGSEGAEEALTESITNLIKTFTEKLPEYADLGAKIVEAIGNGMIENMPELLESSGEMTRTLNATMLKTIGSLFVNLGKQIIEAIKTGLQRERETTKALGKNIIEGIGSGIKSALGWLEEQMEFAAGGIVGVIRRALGIHSPSTVFAEIGENMALGLGVGFEREMGAVSAGIQSSIPTPTIETINNAAAGMVNGLGAVSQPAQPAIIILQLSNGTEFARWLLPDLRAAQRANPEVVSGV